MWVCACPQVTPSPPSWPDLFCLGIPGSFWLGICRDLGWSSWLREWALLGLGSLRGLSSQAAGSPVELATALLGQPLLLLPTVWARVGSSLGLLCPVSLPVPVLFSPHFCRTVGEPSVGTGNQIAMTSPGGTEEAEGLERGWGWPVALAFPQNSDGKSRWRCGKWLFRA